MKIRFAQCFSVLGLAAFAVATVGCQGGGAFPSYAGIYELEGEPEVVLSGAEGWPYTPVFPQTLTVVQDVFGRPSGIQNEVRLAIGTDEPGLEGRLGTIISENGQQELGRKLLEPERWDDDTSPLVDGFKAGHRCHYILGASMGVRISPAPFTLVNLYPGTYSSDPQLAPPVEGGWPTPRLTLTFSAGKYNDDYAEYPCARVVAGSYRVTLRYRRVVAEETVDLRFPAPDWLQTQWAEMEARPDSAPAVFPLPDNAFGLLGVFGR